LSALLCQFGLLNLLAHQPLLDDNRILLRGHHSLNWLDLSIWAHILSNITQWLRLVYYR
jgi:hypothetical protein